MTAFEAVSVFDDAVHVTGFSHYAWINLCVHFA